MTITSLQQNGPASGFRALVVTAHPDDMEFGCAGTLALWADRGADITLCIATDGSTGTQDKTLMGESLSDMRRREAEEAAKIVGVSKLVWMGYRDGYVEYSLDLRRDVARMFRRYKPHRFVVMDPTPTIEDRFINHPDHRALGLASLDTAMTAGTTPGHFPELIQNEDLDPWRGLRELWIQGPGEKPVAVDISATIDRKVQALLCHRSQVGDNSDEIARFVRERAALKGERSGYGFAESFQIISEGPGFHAGEQEEEVDLGDMATAPTDPRSHPTA